jgi:hypothetical protein
VTSVFLSLFNYQDDARSNKHKIYIITLHARAYTHTYTHTHKKTTEIPVLKSLNAASFFLCEIWSSRGDKLEDFPSLFSYVVTFHLVPASSQQYPFDICQLLYVQSWTPDGGRKDRSKHVECHSKILVNKFDTMVHLVGFTREMYYDARPYERQITFWWLISRNRPLVGMQCLRLNLDPLLRPLGPGWDNTKFCQNIVQYWTYRNILYDEFLLNLFWNGFNVTYMDEGAGYSLLCMCMLCVRRMDKHITLSAEDMMHFYDERKAHNFLWMCVSMMEKHIPFSEYVFLWWRST